MREPYDPLNGGPEDDALRAWHARLEREAIPDAAFEGELFAWLRSPEARGRSRDRTLAILGLTAALVGALVIGAVLFLFRPYESTLGPTPSGSVLPNATPTFGAVVDSPSPSVTTSPTASATATATTATPSATATVAPAPPTATAPPSPETPAPTPTQEPGATPTEPPPPPDIGGEWEPVAPMPATDSPRIADIELGPDGRIYVLTEWVSENDVGGLIAYDPQADTWTPIDAPNQPAVGTDGILLAGPDGLLYQVDAGGDATRVHAFDPASGEWQPEPVAILDYLVADAVFGPDGRLYSIDDPYRDGRSDTRMSAYDISTGEQELLAAVRGVFGPFLESDGGDRIFVVGEDGLASYDPANDRWQLEDDTSMPDVRHNSFSLGPDGRFYVIPAPEQPLELFAFDTGERAWLTVTPPPEWLSSVALAPGPDGRLYALDDAYQFRPQPRDMFALEPER